MADSLTKLPDTEGHLLWAELAGDSAVTSLRFSTLGWIPRKRHRIEKVVSWFSFAVLERGEGTFRAAGDREARPIQAPGFFMQAPGMPHDYGPVRGGRWEEFYWTLEGERVREWERGGWWHREPRFESLTVDEATELRRLFDRSCRSLELRDGNALDEAKLGVERWLARRARRAGAPPEGSLASTVERWRQDLQRDWSMPAAAAAAGLSYTRFRTRFLREFGTSPYDHLLRLRIELAERWLESTDEPVKAVAARCGFGGAEAFVRAFGRRHGISPGLWRARRRT